MLISNTNPANSPVSSSGKFRSIPILVAESKLNCRVNPAAASNRVVVFATVSSILIKNLRFSIKASTSACSSADGSSGMNAVIIPMKNSPRSNSIGEVVDLDSITNTSKPATLTRRVAAAELRGALELQDVSFSYHSGIPVLKNLDLLVPAGTTVAVVGATGAGKSTLIKLFLRFLDPTTGRVVLDGVDLRELDLADLRSAIGFVCQDVFLFHGSVRENIAYGRPMPAQKMSRERLASPRPRSSSSSYPTATTRSWGSAARSSPGANASESRSRGLY